MTDEQPWILALLVHELDDMPELVTARGTFIAHANDLLERIDSDWRIDASGDPRKVVGV